MENEFIIRVKNKIKQREKEIKEHKRQIRRLKEGKPIKNKDLINQAINSLNKEIEHLKEIIYEINLIIEIYQDTKK